MDYQSSTEVLAAIVEIFPDFAATWERDNPHIEEGRYSTHAVYMSFLPFLVGVDKPAKKLERVGSLVNGAVFAGGDSENAISTCFLEHLHQVGLGPVLKPYLDNASRQRLRV